MEFLSLDFESHSKIHPFQKKTLFNRKVWTLQHEKICSKWHLPQILTLHMKKMNLHDFSWISYAYYFQFSTFLLHKKVWLPDKNKNISHKSLKPLPETQPRFY